MVEMIERLKNTTKDNIWDLTEEEVFQLVMFIQKEVKKEEQIQYMKIIEPAFKFRTISSRNRALKQDLTYIGYKFFKNKEQKGMLTGVYKNIR